MWGLLCLAPFTQHAKKYSSYRMLQRFVSMNCQIIFSLCGDSVFRLPIHHSVGILFPPFESPTISVDRVSVSICAWEYTWFSRAAPRSRAGSLGSGCFATQLHHFMFPLSTSSAVLVISFYYSCLVKWLLIVVLMVFFVIANGIKHLWTYLAMM